MPYFRRCAAAVLFSLGACLCLPPQTPYLHILAVCAVITLGVLLLP
jgi:hypothetical protein